MGNPTRTLVILVVLSLGGISALAFMAQRYARVVGAGEALATERALERVDRFIEVRHGMHREVQSWGRGGPRAGALTRARDRGLVLHRIDPEDYAEVRASYRAWREGRLPAGTPLGAALDRRRAELLRVDLGSYEPLDA